MNPSGPCAVTAPCECTLSPGATGPTGPTGTPSPLAVDVVVGAGSTAALSTDFVVPSFAGASSLFGLLGPGSSAWNPSTNTFTVPAAGPYTFCGNWIFSGTLPGGALIFYFLVNGIPVQIYGTGISITQNPNVPLVTYATGTFRQGDRVNVAVTCATGTLIRGVQLRITSL